MGSTISSASMSLDGFVSDPDHRVGRLFEWYDAGDVAVANAGSLPDFHLTQTSAEYWLHHRETLGALVVGRTLFDLTDGWEGVHPLDVPFVVLTHEPPADWAHAGTGNAHFVTGGIVQAVARAHDLAGGGDVGVAAGTCASQALAAGLLDAVTIDLVPVVMGSGHPYFTDDVDPGTVLGDPVSVIEGSRVTHLTFPVLR